MVDFNFDIIWLTYLLHIMWLTNLFIPIGFDAHGDRLDPWLSAKKDSVQQCVYARSDNALSMLTKECVFFHLDKSEGPVFLRRVEPLDRRDHTTVVYLAVEENLG